MKKNTNSSYFGTLFQAFNSLGTGLKTTMKEFFTKKVTEQ